MSNGDAGDCLLTGVAHAAVVCIIHENTISCSGYITSIYTAPCSGTFLSLYRKASQVYSKSVTQAAVNRFIPQFSHQQYYNVN